MPEKETQRWTRPGIQAHLDCGVCGEVLETSLFECSNIRRVFRVGLRVPLVGHIFVRRTCASGAAQRRGGRSAAGGGGKQPRVVRANIEPVIFALSSLSKCTGYTAIPPWG